jgi:acyl-CoA synthetase (AMP-forming)/AMP-acid ligase II
MTRFFQDEHADHFAAGIVLPAMIARRVQTKPQATSIYRVTFVGKEPRAESISYEDLWSTVCNIASTLVRSDIKSGDRVLLSIADVRLFLGAFLASQCIGAIPIPVPASSELPDKAYDRRVESVVEDARPGVMLHDYPISAPGLQGKWRSNVQIHDLSSLSHDAVVASKHIPGFNEQRTANEVAFLQYTSGSTGRPKGVVVLHSNLMANLRALADALGITADDISYSWLPLFHDMGLVAGLLLGLYADIATYVARPRSFIGRPDSWLQAITKYRASISGGPNFAFAVLARSAARRTPESIDLSSWRIAFDGSEVIDPQTTRKFIQHYSSRGFRAESLCPAYGMAECTLGATLARPGSPVGFDRVSRTAIHRDAVARSEQARKEDVVEYVSLGPPLPEHKVRICATDSPRELPERHVGEIVLQGPSVSPGYFGRANGRSAETGLRTGDIGYLVDGELFIVDRLKDLIAVAGRKHAPADVEQIVGRLEAVRTGAVAAFSALRDGREEMFIMMALEPSNRAHEDEARDAVCRTVHVHFGVAPARVFIVPANAIPRTSSGKLRRTECRRMLESGVLDMGSRKALE